MHTGYELHHVGVHVVFALFCTGSVACNDSVVARSTGLGFGAPCGDGATCIAPLVCTEATCQPAGSAGAGQVCVVGADCADGLTCEQAFCVPQGSVQLGEACNASAECSDGLRCETTELGVFSECRPAGDAYLGDGCVRSADCLDGLVCDPATSECATQFSPPFGASCSVDADCDPDQGIACLAGGVCSGLGPDGAPVPVWDGAACPDPNIADGGFRIYLERADGDFYRMPFPNDTRRRESGLDLAGFPIPDDSLPAASVVREVVDVAGSDADGFGKGFGSHQSVFMRFSAPPLFCGVGCGEPNPPASEAGCIGQGELEPSVYVVDLTRDERGNFLGFATGLAFFWRASTAPQAYLCGPWLGVRPTFDVNAPTLSDRWKPGHTYAVFVHSRVRGCDGSIRVDSSVDPNITAALGSSSPLDPELVTIWDAYGPLREWLATSPEYPGGGAVAASDVLGASVFTVRDPTAQMDGIVQAIADQPALTFSDVVECAAAGVSPCASGDAFAEYQGRVLLPNFQNGTVPYVEDGGELTFLSEVPIRQGVLDVRFSLSLPGGNAPETGWPVVIYAHGTGGSERSHIENGIARRLASVAVESGTAQFAVLGIEQVGHGLRAGESSLDRELIVFNILNPAAARGNALQGAADQLSLAGAISELSLALEGAAGVSAPLLDEDRVAFLGHSQGGNAMALAGASQNTVDVVVLSGTGGVLLESLDAKSSPFEFQSLLRGALADPGLNDSFFHPVLDLVQGYFEDADPGNFSRRFAREVPDGLDAKHVLNFIGVGDTFTPNGAGMAFARGLGGSFVNDDGSALVTENEAVAGADDFPLAETLEMRSVVSSVHEPAEGRDGHFVVFEDLGKAGERAAAFLGQWALSGQPSVIE